MKKLGVIGIGNPLRRDDGIGIILLNKLKEQKKILPKNIELIDGGTSGLDLLHIIARFEYVLCIDAVKFNAPPGANRIFSIDEIGAYQKIFQESTHQINFAHIVELLKEFKELPKKLVIFGVQPKDTTYGEGISKELLDKIEVLELLVKKEIQKLLNTYF